MYKTKEKDESSLLNSTKNKDYASDLKTTNEFKNVKQQHLYPNQFIYIGVSADPNIIHASESFQKVTGYDPKIFTTDDYSKQIHPDDIELIIRAKNTAFLLSESPLVNKSPNSYMVVNYRFRNSDGKYIQLLQYSRAISCDDCNRMILFESRCTDITDHKIDDTAIAKIFIDDELYYVSSKNSSGIDTSALSNREKEIFDLITQNLTSAKIADKLDVSKHTIDTHRRKICQKLKVKNTQELLFKTNRFEESK